MIDSLSAPATADTVTEVLIIPVVEVHFPVEEMLESAPTCSAERKLAPRPKPPLVGSQTLEVEVARNPRADREMNIAPNAIPVAMEMASSRKVERAR